MFGKYKSIKCVKYQCQNEAKMMRILRKLYQTEYLVFTLKWSKSQFLKIRDGEHVDILVGKKCFGYGLFGIFHGLKQKYFQHCDVSNCPAPPYRKPWHQCVVSKRTMNFVNRYTPNIHIYIYIYIYTFLSIYLFILFNCHGLLRLMPWDAQNIGAISVSNILRMF